MEFFRRHRALVIAGAAALVALFIVGGLSIWAAQARNSVRNTGISMQQRLIKDKNNIGIALSNCMDKTTVSTQAAILQSQSVKDILTSALAARYQVRDDGKTTVNPKTQALPNNGSLISVLQEQYPQIDVSTWKQLLVVVDSCRDDTTDAQRILQGDAEQFAAWVESRSIWTNGIRDSFPNEKLYFLDAHGNRLTGQDALEAIRNPVELDAARTANGSGHQTQQNLPGIPTTTPAG